MNPLTELPAFYLKPATEGGKTLYTISRLSAVSGPDPAAGGRYFVTVPYVHPLKESIAPAFYKLGPEENIAIGDDPQPDQKILLRAATPRRQYMETLFRLKREIQQGNIYEVNYCMEFFAEEVRIDPLQVFQRLYRNTYAPYAALVKLGDEFIISASPELFLKREGNLLHTKPIKGTARRGRDSEEDELLRQTLHESVKERTENVMAVDVARNDLSRLAKRGSVQVNKLYNIETYASVHHMVSTVSCELKENLDLNTILAATFPMASMTGAPKVSAMNLIGLSENFKRNYYSGAMGQLHANGDFELAVNIRCIFYNQRTKRLSIAVGSAITHLCEPEKEYEECLLKAKALLAALDAGIEK